ncbi:MAG: hypothetical protein QOI31_709 [Solirubrobacterales bacterium]|jgi:hypothetical protein|nr:hypothetical protein [Solirubrobacterales bacterium]
MLVGGSAALAALAAPVISGGHVTKTATGMELQFEDLEYISGSGEDPIDVLGGDVTSQKKSCTKSRDVELFTDHALFFDPFLTDANGHWEIAIEDPGDGTYFAKVAKKRTGSGQHKHICKSATSPDLVVVDEIGANDSDSDGYFTDEDCNDNDSSTNPDASEVRNHVDDDCDGLADNHDPDGDGFIIGVDCDDTLAFRNPDAKEFENGMDDNCDGIGDAGLFDGDEDGVAGEADCDDGSAGVKPTAAEVSADGVDNDCDGKSDNSDFDGDGFVVPEDCDDTSNGTFPGGTEALDGKDNDCDGSSDEAG